MHLPQAASFKRYFSPLGAQLLSSSRRVTAECALSQHNAQRSTRNWQTVGRMMSSSSISSATADKDATFGSSESTIGGAAARQPKLADVIRDGITLLNASALQIQGHHHTRKNIFMKQEEDLAPDPRQLSEEERIFRTAQECLEELCMRDPSFPLMAAEEPVLFIKASVNPSYTFADIYWSLPYSLLSAPELNEQQLVYLQSEMDARLQGHAGRELLKRMHTNLRHYFPPKIRFKVAPPVMVEALLQELEAE